MSIQVIKIYNFINQRIWANFLLLGTLLPKHLVPRFIYLSIYLTDPTVTGLGTFNLLP